MLKLVLVLGLFVSTPATVWASYVNSCLIEGVVLKPTSTLILYVDKGQGDIEENHLQINVSIRKATPDGRADSGCTQFIGQEMTIDISDPPRIAFKKGDDIKIHYFHKNFKGGPNREDYSLAL